MGYLVGLMYRLLHIEIIRHLKKKRLDPEFSDPQINEVDIYKFDPSELPGLSEAKSDEQVWNFFSEPYYKYRKSKRANRTTKTGYWKKTGKERVVNDKHGKKIGRKRTLVFHKRGCASREAKTDWVMHEFYIEDRSGYKKDFVFCYIERNPSNKSNVSTPDDGEPSHSLASDSESHDTEITFTEVESQLQSDCTNQFANCYSTMHVEPQLLPIQNLVSNPRNHFAPNTSSKEVEPQLLPNHNLVSYRFTPNTSSMEVEPQLLPNHNLVSYPINYFTPSTSSMEVEPQLLPNYNLVSGLENYFSPNTFSMIDPQQLAEFNALLGCDLPNHGSAVYAPQWSNNPEHGSYSSHQLAEFNALLGYDLPNHSSAVYAPQWPNNPEHGSYSSQQLAELSAEFNALLGYDLLNHSSAVYAPQWPNNPEHGSYSSTYSNGLGNECTLGCSRFHSEHEDVLNAQWNFQDKYPHEATGQTLPADAGTDDVDALMNELLVDAPPTT